MSNPTDSIVGGAGAGPAKHTHDTTDLGAALRDLAGVDATHCYQCGKCTAGCPMAPEMPTRVHQLIRLVQLNRRERLLNDESMWLCLTCETCTSRCPNQVDPARLVDGLRELALREGIEPPRTMRAFHRAFLDQIRKRGRIGELGLVSSYKLGGGALFADVGLAPSMLMRGKLRLSSPRVRGIEQLRKMMDACLDDQEGPS